MKDKGFMVDLAIFGACLAVCVVIWASEGGEKEESLYQNEIVDEYQDDPYIEDLYQDIEKEQVFAPRTHYIYEPISEDVFDGPQVYEYHPGYEPVALDVSTYGKSFRHYGGGAILYVNTEEVVVHINSLNPDDHEFGVPYSVFEENSDIYDVGEHIVSVIYEESLSGYDNGVISVPDGYKIVGFANPTYGEAFRNSSGTIVLFVNTVPVSKYSEGTFKTPIADVVQKNLNNTEYVFLN